MALFAYYIVSQWERLLKYSVYADQYVAKVTLRQEIQSNRSLSAHPVGQIGHWIPSDQPLYTPVPVHRSHGYIARLIRG